MKDAAIVAMSPIDALDYACLYSGVLEGGYRTPGYAIERMPPNVRTALQRLTSDDALKLRPRLLGK